jgi:hypothetical protein
VGQSTAARNELGFDEIVFVTEPEAGTFAKVVIANHPGSGPIRSQASGLLVVPTTHLLNAKYGPIADDVAVAAAALADTRLEPGTVGA